MASLRFALGCVVLAYPAGPASAAGKYDGSKPMLCAITSTTECTADGKCERSAPQAGNNLPTFVRVDVKGSFSPTTTERAEDRDQGRDTSSDGQLMLQGDENGKAWSIVIASESGAFGSSVVEDDGLFAMFGNCTLP